MEKTYINNLRSKKNNRSKLSSTILLRIYRRMKSQPNKIFIRADFRGNDIINYMKTLRALELIDVLPAVYRTGKKNTTTRRVLGFRLKKNKEILEQVVWVCSECGK